MKVLVATDGSDRSMKAVNRALEMAQTKGAEITLMSVAYWVTDWLEEMPANMGDKLKRQAREALDKAGKVLADNGIHYKTILEVGTVPANLIIKEAEEGNYDEVILGASGTHEVQKILMGSVAAKVVAHAPCSVLVVR